MTDNPLATDFPILDGFRTITVPDVEPGDDWSIVREYHSLFSARMNDLTQRSTVFGDSGNNSPDFTIAAASA